MMTAFLDGLVAGYGIAIPVGAIAVLILGTGMREGFKPASAAGAGAATADLVYATVAVVAGAAASALLAPYATALRNLSALVVGVIGVYGLMTARRDPMVPGSILPARPLNYYVRFVGLTLVNPMTVVYFTSLVVGLGLGAGLSPAAGAVFAGGAFLASLSWQLLLAGLGAAVGKRLSPRFRLLATIAGNLIILAFAARILAGR